MKKPTSKSLIKFSERWNAAQKRLDIKSMESLLTKKWLNHWWWLFADSSSHYTQETYRSGLERTLIKEGLVGERPERPSERAMRMSDKSTKNA